MQIFIGWRMLRITALSMIYGASRFVELILLHYTIASSLQTSDTDVGRASVT